MTLLEKTFGFISFVGAVSLGWWTVSVGSHLIPVLRGPPMIDSKGNQMPIVILVDYPLVRWQVVVMLAVAFVAVVGLAWLGFVLFFSRRHDDVA